MIIIIKKKLFKYKVIYYLIMVNNIFTENENKALLWEILQDSFNKIDQTDYSNFKQFFESHIQKLNLEMQSNGVNELMEKNKFFIQNTLLLINKNEWKYKYNKALYTSDEIKEKNINEFEERFLQRQKDFSNLINVNKPEELSFEDSNNNFNEDINEQLERMQREREKEISFNEKQEPDPENSFKKIQIFDEDIPKKKVTFNNLIDSIETNDNMKDSIKTEFINDIKGDIQFIKSEIAELKRLMNSFINKDN